MKELSIEEKAKAYNGLIERLKDLKFACRFSPLSDTIEEMFPELKENEDERIRKDIVFYIAAHHKDDGEKARWLAWLEKQGNKDMGISNTTKQKLKDNLDNALQKETPESWNEFLEKQGEQKPTDTCDSSTINGKEFPASEKRDFGYFSKPADKVESKFHEGEWVVSPNGVYWHIDRIENNRYEVSSTNGACADWPLDTDLYHLWTIKDAKDGDVLVASDGSIFLFKCTINCVCRHYVALTTDGVVKFNKGLKHYWETSTAVHPATKEQRNLLFQKMHEAGYEWNAEKKELKKAKQKQVITYPDNLPKDNWELIHEFVNKFGRIPKDEDELNVLVEYILNKQKPAWSEEDKKVINLLLELVYEQDKISPRIPSNEKRKMMLSWLKSLRPQNRWKPSEGQLECLGYAIEKAEKDWSPLKNNRIYLTLKALKEQLEKL